MISAHPMATHSLVLTEIFVDAEIAIMGFSEVIVIAIQGGVKKFLLSSVLFGLISCALVA